MRAQEFYFDRKCQSDQESYVCYEHAVHWDDYDHRGDSRTACYSFIPLTHPNLTMSTHFAKGVRNIKVI